MAVVSDDGLHKLLGRQALGRSLTAIESELARALEAIFASGEHDLEKVVRLLEQKAVKRPSGSAGGWTVEVLGQELARINASLDEAYAANGGALAQGSAP